MKSNKLVQLLLLVLVWGLIPRAYGQKEILNASYDISRELFEQINASFVPYWKAKSGEDIVIKQSHAGSSKQARSILEGLQADVVTFNQNTDIDVLVKGDFVAPDWTEKFPNHSSPYYSLTSFLVRKGNPKGIKDWADLAKPGVSVIFPNPKTSGNGRYTYLALWAHASAKYGKDEDKITDYVGKVLNNVPIFDTGGRGASTTFVEHEIGDVLVTFEAETNAIKKQYGADKYEVVTPTLSVLAEFPVAVVNKVTSKRGSSEVANAYLSYLYTPAAQEILAKNYYRVNDSAVAAKYARQFSKVKLVRVEEEFGGWDKAQKTHFDKDGTFDKIIAKIKQ